MGKQEEGQDDGPAPVSLITHHTLEEFDPAPRKNTPGVVSYAPPMPNWHAWRNCNIDEGPMATVSDIITELGKRPVGGCVCSRTGT